jgi:hypothetical protein
VILAVYVVPFQPKVAFVNNVPYFPVLDSMSFVDSRLLLTGSAVQRAEKTKAIDVSVANLLPLESVTLNTKVVTEPARETAEERSRLVTWEAEARPTETVIGLPFNGV